MIQKNTLYMIGNTHFDPVWLWTWDEAMSSIRSTFRSALDRMKEYPDFIYSFCTPPVFEWIRETDPDMFAEIKERVAEGRWDLAEGFWVQPDCNAPHGESFVRHGLYTQRYLSEVFGRRATTVFNTDSFGHNINLPQIMKKCGLDFYAFSRPSVSEKDIPGPLFKWRAPDGSEVTALRTGHFPGMYNMDIKRQIRKMNEILPGLDHGYAFVYGVSNHGGAPTRQCLEDICGMIGDAGLDFNVKFGSTTDFFTANAGKPLPVLSDELQVKFFGPYGNAAEIKNNNRIVEYAAMRAEKAAVFAGFHGKRPYPGQRLAEAWKDILFNQFHDILGGACIKHAYFDARNLHGRALHQLNEITHYSLQYITRQIAMPGSGLENSEWNVALYNLNGIDYNGAVEAEVQWAWEYEWYDGDIELVDGGGVTHACQIIRELSVIPAFRSRFAFRATIPAFGYNTYAVRRKNAPKPDPGLISSLIPGQGSSAADGSGGVTGSAPAAVYNLKPDEPVLTLENSDIRITIDGKTGNISSVSAIAGSLLCGAFAMTVRQDDGDTWAFNVKGYGDECEPIGLVESGVIERGALFTTLKTKSRFRDSILEQYFTLYNSGAVVDYRYCVNWNEKHKVLKLDFISDGDWAGARLTASAAYCGIGRAFDGAEYPVGEWLDVSAAGKGFSLLMRNNFAYDAFRCAACFGGAGNDGKNNCGGDGSGAGFRLGVTALRSPVYGDLRMGKPLDGKADYDYLNQGVSEGSLRLIFHTGDFAAARIPELASAFNNPPVAVIEANHAGTLPSSGQFLNVSSRSTMAGAVKQSEDGDGVVLRLVEYGGARDTARVYVSGKPVCDADMGTYEIKTLKIDVSDMTAKEVNMLEE